MTIVQASEDSNILLKGVTKTIKNETKEEKGGFLSMLLGTLGASLLGNLLSGKGIVRAGSGNKKRKSNCQSWLWKQNGFLMPSHPVTNFEIKRYYQNEPIFNSVYSRNNLFKKIKDGANVINLDEHAEISQRKLCSKKLRKYVSAFDYIDKILIVHSATTG